MASDPRTTLARSFEVAGSVIAGIGDDQWQLSTPCTEFNVVQLTEHLIGATNRPGDLVSGGTVDGPIETPGVVPEGGFDKLFAEAQRSSNDAFAGDGVLEKEFTLPWGTFSGAALAHMYAMEATVHAWDLAIATGQTDKLDDQVAAEILPIAKEMLPPDYRGGEVPFAAVVEAAPDARPADQLAAYLGRAQVS